MSVNLLTLILSWSVLSYTNLPSTPNNPIGDTVIVASTGTANLVLPDSLKVDSISLPSVEGEIIQNGNQNHVEINSGKSPKSAKSAVIIKQTGDNNSIKINSQ